MEFIPDKDLILFIAGFLNLVLGFLILFKNKDRASVYYVLVVLAAAAWSFGIAFFRITENFEIAVIWSKFYYIAAVLIGASLLSFSFVFPFKQEKIKTSYKILFFIFTGFVLLVSVWPGAMIEKLEKREWGKEIILSGIYYSIYSTYFVMCMIGAFSNFLKKYKRANHLQKIQIKYVFIGTLIATILGSLFNLILPFFGNYKLIWLGPYFTLVMIGFIAYAISRHHLLNVRVIATEIFSALIAVFVLVDALLSKTTTEFVLKFALFGGVAVFGVLIIKSVLNEIKSREKITQISEDLRIANIELKRLDQSKSDFLSIASHQLRTPLTAIKGYSSMILEGEFGALTNKVREAVDKVFQSSQRLVLIVDDFLNISRIEAGTMKYEFVEFDLQKITETIVNDFTANNENAKRLKLKFFTQKADFTVKGDQNKIAQVVSNLVDNSLKYTPSGFVKVFLSAGDSGKTVLLKVQDTGVGISKDTIPRLFQKFSRAEDVSRLHTGGTGLGLYIAKRIIEDHRGRIWAESEGEGKGSTFFVELPRG